HGLQRRRGKDPSGARPTGAAESTGDAPVNRPLPSDDALRSLHAQSLQALSPATLARLRSARHNAGAAHAGRWRWWLASACSLVIALGIGVQFVGPGDHQGPIS